MKRMKRQLTPTNNVKLRMELIKKKHMLWSMDQNVGSASPPRQSKPASDSVSDCESDDSDSFNPSRNMNWRTNSFQRRRKSLFHDKILDTTKSISITLKLPEPSPAVAANNDSDSDTTIPIPHRVEFPRQLSVEPQLPVESLFPVEAPHGSPDKDTVVIQNGHSSSDEASIEDDEHDNIFHDTDDSYGESPCMFDGGSKRNLRDVEPVSHSASLRQGNNETTIRVAENCYSPGAFKYKFLVDSVIQEVSNFTNYESEYVYFSAEYLQDDRPVTIRKDEVVWTEEYPGCNVSRSKITDTISGLMKISPRTIRPFSRVESKQPMHIVVINGEITLKANFVCRTVSQDKQYALERIVFKTGEIIILRGGSWFSLENHTANTVDLSYSFFDVI